MYEQLIETYSTVIGDLLYERYNTGDDSSTSIYGTHWLAQTFTIGNTGSNINHNISSVKLKLFRCWSSFSSRTHRSSYVAPNSS